MRTVRNIIECGHADRLPALAVLDEVRCGCGSLLARVVGGEVELKCRRCKHVWRVTLGDGDDAGVGPADPHRRPEAVR